MSGSTNSNSSYPENISRVAPLNEVKELLNASLIISIIIGVGVNLVTSFQGGLSFFLGLGVILVGIVGYLSAIQSKISEWENRPYAIWDSTMQWSPGMTTQSATIDPQLSQNTPSSSSFFIGSINTRKYHNGNCPHITRIQAGNRVIFLSVSDAVVQGYVPCQICNPR